MGSTVTLDQVRAAAEAIRPFIYTTPLVPRRAVLFLFEHSRLVVEPSGAVGVAALLGGQLPVSGKNVVVVLTGGNISLDALQEMRRDLIKRQ